MTFAYPLNDIILQEPATMQARTGSIAVTSPDGIHAGLTVRSRNRQAALPCGLNPPLGGFMSGPCIV